MSGRLACSKKKVFVENWRGTWKVIEKVVRGGFYSAIEKYFWVPHKPEEYRQVDATFVAYFDHWASIFLVHNKYSGVGGEGREGVKTR